MSNPQTIKIGVVGVGYLGEFHVQQLLTLPYVSFLGITDLDPKRGKIISEKYNVAFYQEKQDLIDLCDGIIIVTPTSSHYSIALDALNSGKHVFIEKPITSTIEQADQLIDIANEKDLMIQVGHIERFNPAFLLLKEKKMSAQFIEVHRLASFKSRGQDTSVVLDLMIHDIDIILAIIDSHITDIQATGVNVITSETDIANARITFENGCIVNLTASRISLKEMRKMRIFQEQSYVNIDFLNKTMEEYEVTQNQDIDSSTQIFPYDDSGKQFIKYSKNEGSDHNALLEELKHFIDSIQNNTTPEINGNIGRDALHVALIIQDKINE
tara:strand:+ start:418 stop:1395 length:978 start_codon:yes stop_codon:yes gene_type:complete